MNFTTLHDAFAYHFKIYQNSTISSNKNDTKSIKAISLIGHSTVHPFIIHILFCQKRSPLRLGEEKKAQRGHCALSATITFSSYMLLVLIFECLVWFLLFGIDFVVGFEC